MRAVTLHRLLAYYINSTMLAKPAKREQKYCRRNFTCVSFSSADVTRD